MNENSVSINKEVFRDENVSSQMILFIDFPNELRSGSLPDKSAQAARNNSKRNIAPALVNSAKAALKNVSLRQPRPLGIIDQM
ncbi:hypothetical protein [Thalassospira xiamenensis]|uniref:hypothetical protein n=1 Tax=Thalassospira xiamenensis TaxID=220697 RepID=UPI000BE48550|nr:hypothetical protein [Thalassospira xiamenensis]